MFSILTSVGLIISTLSVLPKFPDSESAPYPYVTSASGGRLYFKMIPDAEDWLNLEKGSGTVYKVVSGKKDKVMWSIDGWYAFLTYLSYKGDYLVRLGNWPRGHQPSEAHLAVAFYKRGKLLKSYSTKELIKDTSKVQPSISHYRFYTGRPHLLQQAKHLFELETIDGVKYKFNITNGEIVSTESTVNEPL